MPRPDDPTPPGRTATVAWRLASATSLPMPPMVRDMLIGLRLAPGRRADAPEPREAEIPGRARDRWDNEGGAQPARRDAPPAENGP